MTEYDSHNRTELENGNYTGSGTAKLLGQLRARRWAFLGTPQIAVDFLERLRDDYEVQPSLIVTNPDRKTGRKQVRTAPPVKEFAIKHNIQYLQPEKPAEILDVIREYEFVLVFAYHHILGQQFLDAVDGRVLNIHPSLLPQYRGPSPIISAILDDTKQTGVTIIELDQLMDHGSIVAQILYTFFEWERNRRVEKTLAEAGADLFVQTVNGYLDGYIKPQEQNHEDATYCRKYTKADMEIDRTAPPDVQYRTYCAFPKPFFMEGSTRIVVTKAEWLAEHKQFVIKKVIPEGKKETDFLSVVV